MNASPAEHAPRWPAWTLLAFVALWPTGAPAEAVLVLGGLAALLALASRRAALAPEAMALCSLFFLAYWLPQLFSAVDALDARRAWHEVIVDLRYLPFLWLAALAVATPRLRRLTFSGLAAIATLWCLDGLVQAVTGFSLGGESSVRLTGIFGAHNPKLGLVLAALSPFTLYAAHARYGRLGWSAAALALIVVVMLAGARAGWLMLALALSATGWRIFGLRGVLLGGAVAAVLAVGVGALFSERLAERLERTAAVFDGAAGGLDHALSGRLVIWEAALRMLADYPVNGVGVRGYRVAYPDYAPHVEQAWGEGEALHAHQWLLEVAAETGLLGLALWFAGIAFGLRAWRRAEAAARARARAPALALVLVLFPLNTHLAVYSTFWGGTVLLLAGLYAGALLARR
ncbi:MAG: O-antigen ligase family protein [Rehaibacterium terrae]|uniref:O-antigen ligase family protein n=1 Tax=Rehaibacterium terrae TaxID=1341696 RepID=UPI00391D5ED8